MDFNKCFCRGELVSARYVCEDVIEIFNRRNQIICIVSQGDMPVRVFRGLVRLVVMSLDDGAHNFEFIKAVGDLFPSYDCCDGEYDFELARRNWPKFPSHGDQSSFGAATSQRRNGAETSRAEARNVA